jgi:uncharacterized damage-inducible protein DinB
MAANTQSTTTEDTATLIDAPGLLRYWQGHRGLTRRVIESFPDDKLFTHSIGGMRPFSTLVMEFLSMAEPVARGVATGKWDEWKEAESPKTKADLLRLWDEATEALDRIWPTIPPHRFQEVEKAFGQYEGSGMKTILYAIDNEIHHRGQGYVYLRSLGIEPPAFWDHDRV